jgi:hypothetical protein
MKTYFSTTALWCTSRGDAIAALHKWAQDASCFAHASEGSAAHKKSMHMVTSAFTASNGDVHSARELLAPEEALNYGDIADLLAAPVSLQNEEVAQAKLVDDRVDVIHAYAKHDEFSSDLDSVLSHFKDDWFHELSALSETFESSTDPMCRAASRMFSKAAFIPDPDQLVQAKAFVEKMYGHLHGSQRAQIERDFVKQWVDHVSPRPRRLIQNLDKVMSMFKTKVTAKGKPVFKGRSHYTGGTVAKYSQLLGKAVLDRLSDVPNALMYYETADPVPAHGFNKRKCARGENHTEADHTSLRHAISGSQNSPGLVHESIQGWAFRHSLRAYLRARGGRNPGHFDAYTLESTHQLYKLQGLEHRSSWFDLPADNGLHLGIAPATTSPRASSISEALQLREVPPELDDAFVESVTQNGVDWKEIVRRAEILRDVLWTRGMHRTRELEGMWWPRRPMSGGDETVMYTELREELFGKKLALTSKDFEVMADEWNDRVVEVDTSSHIYIYCIKTDRALCLQTQFLNHTACVSICSRQCSTIVNDENLLQDKVLPLALRKGAKRQRKGE